MPLWSRSTTSQPSPSTSTTPLPSTSTPSSSSSTSQPSPLFLANHHRSSSSNLPAALSSTSPPSNTSLARPSRTKRKDRSSLSAPSEAASLGADDDPWADNSDDETSVADLAGRIQTVGLSVKPPSVVGTPTEPSAGGASPASASTSSWFNPFSSSSSRTTPQPPSRQGSTSSLSATTTTASPSAGAEAVAAALLGRPSPSSTSTLAPPTTSAGKPSLERNGASYLAGASKVQEEADRAVREEERRASVERGEVSPLQVEGESGEEKEGGKEEEGGEMGETEEERDEREKREKRAQQEQWKKAIREDVDELVKDPAHVLHRLRLAWAPPPPPSPKTRQTAHRASISSTTSTSAADPSNPTSPSDPDASFSSFTPGEGAEEEDDDRPAGYAPLDPSSLSSHDPTIYDYSAPPPNPEEEGERGRENRRKRKFLEVLGADSVDLAELRKLAWNGVPGELRSMVWGLLLGYLPLPLSRRATTLSRKRTEYAHLVKQTFRGGASSLSPQIWHQISIDVPRTRPGVLLWTQEATQRSLERVLYVWAIRHPASGYVQGINDLACPFFEVFLSGYIDSDPSLFSLSLLPPHVLEALEADTFWCLSKLLDGIQDNYIFAQPGIQRLVGKMEGLCQRVDAPLAAHLKSEGVEFIQFAFRWMNCLLMRELSVRNIVRMWDTYLAEGGDAFSEFHLYVCLAFLVRWSDKLREMDFQSIIIFLQSLPTQDWTDKDTELLLSEAFLWSRTFQAR